MATALTADLPLVTNPEVEIVTKYMRVVGADIFYKGALVWYTAAGFIEPVPANDLECAGVVLEHKVTTAESELVRVAIRGEFRFNNTGFTIANTGKLFMPVAPSDDPQQLIPYATGTTCAVGMLSQVKDDATNGWILIDTSYARTLSAQ